jgi:hypothetical protein
MPFQISEPPKKRAFKAVLERQKVPKRNLRVVKWIGQVPAIGVCTFCNREFRVPLTAMKRVANAQESLRVQFTEHMCKDEMAPENASGNDKARSSHRGLPWRDFCCLSASAPVLAGPVSQRDQLQHLLGVLLDCGLPAKFRPMLFIFHFSFDATRVLANP